jgi:H+/Cl- antiporter ClcA
MLAILVFLVVVLELQDTTHAVIVARHTAALWVSVLSALTGVIVLRSRWGASEERSEKQLEFGTLQNDYYQPRRQALVQGGAVLGGVAGALWWGVQSWVLLFAGMRRQQATRGLWDFEMSVLVGALAWGVVGATLGLVAGQLWEQWHRKRRRRPR